MADAADALRVGLLLDSTIVVGWQAALIGELLRARYCRVELAIFSALSTAPSPSLGERLAELGPAGTSMARWYLAWEERWHRPTDDPLAPCDIAAQLHGIPELRMQALGAGSDALGRDDLERIRGAQLDVLIRLGSGIASGPILRAARYGVWSLYHGDVRTQGVGEAEGFWEVWNREPVTRTVVQVLTDEPDGGMVLYRSALPTRLGSVAHNRRTSYRLGARLIPRQLQELQRVGAEAFFARAREDNPPLAFSARPLPPLPSNVRFTGSLVKHWWGKLMRRIDARSTQRRWVLLFAFGEGPSPALHRFRRLSPPSGRFWADPFVLFEGGRHYVFFEELEYRRGKGHICVVSLNRDGTVSAAQKVLERPYHLSYPFLLRWRGELYMIPETGDQGTVEAYRCTRFPDQWEFHGSLMRHQPLYDATLFEWGGRWWLFATLTRELCDVELHLFFADNPLSGTWTPHPANPVVSDISRARPAGSLFPFNGRLYRPAQDSSRYYGYAVRLQEIMKLTEEEYRERDAASILPEWDPTIVGVHHISFAGDLTVIDAQVRRRRFPGRR